MSRSDVSDEERAFTGSMNYETEEVATEGAQKRVI